MKIDITITFNDIDKDYRTGVVKSLSWSEQLIKLINSIKNNWNKSINDYDIYVLHSKPIKNEKLRLFLKSNTNLILDKEEVLGTNRITAYNQKTDGDFTLVLDTDILILNHPKFSYECNFYAKKAGGPMISNKTWSIICKEIGVKENVYAINNGCILVNNQIKNDIYNDLKKYKQIVKSIIEYNNDNSHFDDQVLMSVLLTKYNGSFFNENINYFTNNNKPINENKIEILHYLGSNGLKNPFVHKIINRY